MNDLVFGMAYLSIVFFFVCTFCLGFTATNFVKNSGNFLERNLMRLGMGLSLITFVGLILNLLRVPLDWKIISGISLVYPAYYFIKNYRKFDFSKYLKIKITKTDLSIIAMLLIFIGTFYIYGTGAFNYPYLEDDDPWSHAISVKYVSIEKTVFGENFHYMDPYPPTYDMLMGILHQTNDSVYWTLKFFNALIISLSVVFFYFFAKEFMGNRNKALFATFALASIPCFLSHFIWAISLTMPLIFVSFYCVERIKHDGKWWIVAALVMITTLTSSPTHSVYFGVLFVFYWLTKTIVQRKFLPYETLAGIAGLAMSFVLWWLPAIIKYGGFKGLINKLGLGTNTLFNVAGTADRTYIFSDFVWAKTVNMINNPIGIGIVLSVIAVIGLVVVFIMLKKDFNNRRYYLILSLVWFIIMLYSVNASNMPIKISPFRAWMLLAIPVCILAAEGTFFLTGFLKKFGISKIIVLSLIIIGVLFTSAYQKYTVNTAQWPPGGFWTSFDEIRGYVWLRENLPPNTNVFTFVNNGPVIGMDMYTCHWCEDVKGYMKNGFNQTAEEHYRWLKSRDYEYLAIDGQTARQFGLNETNQKINDIASSNLFRIAYNQQGLLLLNVI